MMIFRGRLLLSLVARVLEGNGGWVGLQAGSEMMGLELGHRRPGRSQI